MKVMTAVAGVMLLVLGLGIYTLRAYSDTAVEMVAKINRAEQAVAGGEWDRAVKSIGDMRRDWDQHKRWWALFIHHQEIDNIDIALTRAEEYIRSRESSLAAGELAILKLLLQHIPEKERVQLKNIF